MENRTIQKAFDELHKQGGKPPKSTAEDKLYITLKYLWEYRTMESIGAEYGEGKSAMCGSIQSAENILSKDKTFRLPDKRMLKKESSSIEYIVVDMTESPINRQKNQKERYSGRNHKLTKREKAFNKRLLRDRTVIEHVNARIKTFKIMSYPYRNHYRRHLLNMSLFLFNNI